LKIADDFLDRPAGTVVALGGLSGTGKSALGRLLSERCAGIQIRSDVVRKSLLGLSLNEKAGPQAYSQDVSERIYEHLCSLVEAVAAAGYNVIVDATFRKEAEREQLQQRIEQRGLRFYGIWCEVPSKVALARIAERKADVSDAGVAVRLQQERQVLGEIKWARLDASGTLEQNYAAARKLILPEF
jgi:predicted kinase